MAMSAPQIEPNKIKKNVKFRVLFIAANYFVVQIDKSMNSMLLTIFICLGTEIFSSIVETGF